MAPIDSAFNTRSDPGLVRLVAHAGNRLDPWYDVYADQALNLRASEIRALFSVVSRPEVVSLAGGMPNLKDLPPR